MTTPAAHHRNFAGRVALVTGGGSGIGRATAHTLADRGAWVVVVGRSAETVGETAAGRPSVAAVVADIAEPADAERAVTDALDRHGRLDILVNNAGAMVPMSLADTDLDVAERLWATNVLGPTMLARAALPALRETGGVIVNVSSSMARKPAPGASQYGASKAALEALTRSWALELAPRVRVNAVAPGPTESGALRAAGLSEEQIQEVKAAEQAQIPLGRRGEPADVVHGILTLSAPGAGWITGQVLDVDGGFTLS